MSRLPQTLSALGEFAFLERLVSRAQMGSDLVVGPGHDCAVVQVGRTRWLLTIDSLVEGRHFRPEWFSPTQLGRKAFAVNASDIAAMGGLPRFALVNVAVPSSFPVRALDRLQRGIVEAATEADALVVGGNLTAAAELSVTIALIGKAPRRLVTRTGAQPGDLVFVTGTLGDAALAVDRLRQKKPVARGLLRRFLDPRPRIEAGQMLSSVASAMIDISDGVVQDLGHICHRSGVGAILRIEQLPLSAGYRRSCGGPELALAGGEDFELLCTIPRRRLGQLQRLRDRLGCPLTEIGEIRGGRRVDVIDTRGQVAVLSRSGYDHFRER